MTNEPINPVPVNTNPEQSATTTTAAAPDVVPVAAPVAPVVNPKISIDDFAKVEIKVGKILTVEKLPKSDKLLKLSVDFGEEKPRQVLSGIAKSFPEEQTLVGRLCPFVTNLQPRLMMGLESQAMILAVSTGDAFSLFSVSDTIPPGTKAK